MKNILLSILPNILPVLSFLVGIIITNYYALKKERTILQATKHIDLVCQSRITWLENFREEFAQVLTISQIIINRMHQFENGRCLDDFDRYDLLKEYKKFKNDLILHINRCVLLLNPNEKEMLSSLKNLELLSQEDQNGKDALIQAKENLESKATKLLKSEWERIKTEIPETIKIILS